MTEHTMFLEWNTLSIQDQMSKFLKERLYEVTLSMGFADNGESEFEITAKKGHVVVLINLENEAQQIKIRGGLDGKYLPIGEKVPKFKETFKSTDLPNASIFFEKVVAWCSDNQDEDLS